MLACVALAVSFGSSTALAAAYGVVVTSTMVITTLLFYVVARERFGWALAPQPPCASRSVWSTSRSSARTCSRSPPAAGFRWSWPLASSR